MFPPASPPGPVRRGGRFGLAAAILLAALGAAAALAAWAAEAVLYPRLEARFRHAQVSLGLRLGCPLHVRNLTVAGSMLGLEGVALSCPGLGQLSARRVEFRLDFRALFAGRLAVRQVDLWGFRADLAVARDPEATARAWLAVAQRARPTRSTGGADSRATRAAGDPWLPPLAVHGATLCVDAAGGGRLATLGALDARVRLSAGGALVADAGAVVELGRERVQLAATLRRGLSEQSEAVADGARAAADGALAWLGSISGRLEVNPPLALPSAALRRLGVASLRLTALALREDGRLSVEGLHATLSAGSRGAALLDRARPLLGPREANAAGAAWWLSSERLSLPLATLLRNSAARLGTVRLWATRIGPAREPALVSLGRVDVAVRPGALRRPVVEDVTIVAPRLLAPVAWPAAPPAGDPAPAAGARSVGPAPALAAVVRRFVGGLARLHGALPAALPTVRVVDGSCEVVRPDGERLPLDGLRFDWPRADSAGRRRVFGALRHRTPDGRRVGLAFTVGVPAVGEPSGPAPNAPLPTVSLALSGPAVSALVARVLPFVLDRPAASFDAELAVRFDPDAGPRVEATGRLALANWTLQHPALASEPVGGITLRAEGGLRFDFARAEFEVDADTLGGRRGVASLWGRVRRDRQRGSFDVAARLRVPRQPCQDIVDALPSGLLPHLQGLRLSGSGGLALELQVDTARPRATYRLVDALDLDGCRFESLGSPIDLDRLNTPFVQQVVEPDGPTAIIVGPGTSDYVPYERLPRHLVAGAIVTEDRLFRRHRGVRLALVRRAIVLGLERGRIVYGGSTITQQLVKNLFLSRDKRLGRKVEEALIALAIEQRLTKERILELYLNCIEYGPGIYGIRRAAYEYFRKEPEALDPVEGAFLMGLKPAPKAAHAMVRAGVFRPYWAAKIRKILRLEQEREDALPPGGIDALGALVPRFYDPKRDALVRPPVVGHAGSEADAP